MNRRPSSQSSTFKGRRAWRTGGVAIYMLVTFPVVVGFLVLGVDYGRIQVAKTQLQTAADASARYAAAGIARTTDKTNVAIAQASAVCSQSIVDTAAPICTSSNVQVGLWVPATNTFTPLTDTTLANAVKVTLSYTPGANGSAPMFSQFLTKTLLTVHSTSIAMESTSSRTVTIPPQGNLWLAGAADNTTITNLQSDPVKYDSSGTSSNTKQRPLEVDLSDLGVSPGDLITFEGVSGQASNGGGANIITNADGQTNYMVALGAAPAASVSNTSVNGIANVRAPLAANMALFMNDSSPTSTNAPSALDFGTTAALNYTSLSPLLKQPFFVGDGQTDSGQVQYVKVPAGATRIFLGLMDAWQWNDNSGSFTINIYHATTITTVK